MKPPKRINALKIRVFRFYGDLDTFKEIIDSYDWPVCQIRYNYLDELTQAGKSGLEYAAEKGVGVIVMESLRRGRLVGETPETVEKIWEEG